jgi:hypothetical protein
MTMTTTIERLRQLAAFYRTKADGLAMAADELNGHHTERAQDRIAETIADAVQVRRTAKRPGRVTHKRVTRSSRAGAHPHGGDPSKVWAVAQVLKAAGKPLAIKELAAAYKAAGGTGWLTGLHNYVRQGYLTRVGSGRMKRYGLKRMPPPPPAAPSPTT